MSEIYLNGFQDSADVLAQYEAPADALDGAKVLFAWYEYANYEGSSLVVFEKDGELWEVNGGHCSCNGLEGQWSPEKTSVEALQKREIYGDSEATAALKRVLADIH